jgi:hypothetical protein
VGPSQTRSGILRPISHALCQLLQRSDLHSQIVHPIYNQSITTSFPVVGYLHQRRSMLWSYHEIAIPKRIHSSSPNPGNAASFRRLNAAAKTKLDDALYFCGCTNSQPFAQKQNRLFWRSGKGQERSTKLCGSSSNI